MTFAELYQSKLKTVSVISAAVLAVCSILLAISEGNYPKTTALWLGVPVIALLASQLFIGNKLVNKLLSFTGLILICLFMWDATVIFFKHNEEEWVFKIGSSELSHALYYFPALLAVFFSSLYLWAGMSSFEKAFDSVDRLWIRAEKIAILLILSFMIGGYCIHIVMRWMAADILPYLDTLLGIEIPKPDAGIPWMEAVLRKLVFWVGMFGAAIATREERHISVEAIGTLANDNQKVWIGILVAFISIFVCFALSGVAFDYLKLGQEMGEHVHGTNIPVWTTNAILFLVFPAMIWRFFLGGMRRFNTEVKEL